MIYLGNTGQWSFVNRSFCYILPNDLLPNNLLTDDRSLFKETSLNAVARLRSTQMFVGFGGYLAAAGRTL